MNLHQKLIEIRKSVKYLQKDASGDGVKYSYVRASTTLAAVREKMDELGVLLIPSVVGTTLGTTPKGTQVLTEVTYDFTWIDAENPKDTLVVRWYAQGCDSLEKGPGKAATYAAKSFILTTFQIATDKDDPDRWAQMVDDNRPEPKEELATDDQKARLRELAKDERLKSQSRRAVGEELRDPELTKGRAGWLIDGAKRFIAQQSENENKDEAA